MNRICVLVMMLCLFACLTKADGSRYAAQSVLSEGKWVKIRVDRTGIFKITYQDLKKMGFSDPAKVSVHGYGGWLLDEDFSQPYIDDLPATDVWRGSDYLLFYAKGPVKWTYKSVSFGLSQVSQFVHENNPYSTYGYYFVTDATPVAEMAEAASPAAGAALKINTFDDYAIHEKDERSVNNSGRELFGESFESSTTQNFTFRIPGITADDAMVTLRFIANPTNSTGKVSLSIDGNQLIEKSIAQNIGYDAVYTKGIEAYDYAAWKGEKNEEIKATVSYSPSGHQSFLDYIVIQAKRQLKSYSEPFTFFRSLQARNNVAQFTVADATSEMLVFDVTDSFHPALIETTQSGSELSFTIPASAELRELALVDLTKSFPSPETVGEVKTQNLHSLPQTEMVILAPPSFVAEAERLAAYHRTKTNLSVVVVTPEQVYNEFSSGTPDATAIRRFMKMFYDRRSSDADAPRFLLLFGDGSYDNRRLTSTWKNVNMDNFLLTYQTQNSLNWYSVVVDDYFGFLADNEGTNLASDKLLLGIGRFPVRTVSQAKEMVDKVISYMDNGNAGNWKNKICYMADDGNGTDGYSEIHIRQSNQLAQTMELKHPEFINNRLFFDSFKKSNEGGRVTYPDVSAGIEKQFREGTLVFNYTGHGNERSLSDELIITEVFIQNATYSALPLWITATCDFTPFDGFQTSAGENVFLNAKSGGIGLFSTTRVAFTDTNGSINEKLMEHLFDKRADGSRMTLGEVIRATKQDIAKFDRVRFLLIGDPALTLSYPDFKAEITEINGLPASGDTVNFRALDNITIKGVILSHSGEKATDFNGSLSATILDSRRTIKTLDNNNKGEAFEYEDYPSVMQKINDAVTDGEFSFSFVVPKDISYTNLPGKISLYALDTETNAEASGAFLKFRVGGSSDDAINDNEGPEIRSLYLNDSTFTDGSRVNETPFLIAVIWDASGVNIGGSSIGHDVTLTIDNNPALSYNLNAYYETLSGGTGEGVVKFAIPELSVGQHSAEFKVWDVLNHSSTQSFTFEVVNNLTPTISELTASPVPARENVTFLLTHNRPETQMQVNIRVYDLTGRLQWEHSENGSSDLFKAYSVTWDLKNNAGGRLRPGVYIYRAAIRTKTSAEATKAKKLIVLGR